MVWKYTPNRQRNRRSQKTDGKVRRRLEDGQRVLVKYVAKLNKQKKLAKKWICQSVALEKISPSNTKSE